MGGQPAVGLRSIITPPVNPQHLVVGGLTPTTYWGYRGGMWWSKKGRKAPRAYAETLEERMELLEATQRSLKAEWLDTYDKLYRLAGRLDAGRRWAGEKPGQAATPVAPKAPENGSDEQIELPPADAPSPVAKMSRSDLMRILSR